jgi:hypothetical protein
MRLSLAVHNLQALVKVQGDTGFDDVNKYRFCGTVDT